MIERTGHRSLPSAVSVKAAPPPAGLHEPPKSLGFALCLTQYHTLINKRLN
jgi:hypothetical protein